jgi:hypothetical protein
MQMVLTPFVAVAAALLAGVMLSGCPNSILWNATEAGIETVLEVPVPTATASPQATPSTSGL